MKSMVKIYGAEAIKENVEVGDYIVFTAFNDKVDYDYVNVELDTEYKVVTVYEGGGIEIDINNEFKDSLTLLNEELLDLYLIKSEANTPKKLEGKDSNESNSKKYYSLEEVLLLLSMYYDNVPSELVQKLLNKEDIINKLF